jgi:hypothetical protein
MRDSILALNDRNYSPTFLRGLTVTATLALLAWLGTPTANCTPGRLIDRQSDARFCCGPPDQCFRSTPHKRLAFAPCFLGVVPPFRQQLLRAIRFARTDGLDRHLSTNTSGRSTEHCHNEDLSRPTAIRSWCLVGHADSGLFRRNRPSDATQASQ